MGAGRQGKVIAFLLIYPEYSVAISKCILDGLQTILAVPMVRACAGFMSPRRGSNGGLL
jgi:hypothetical protein